MAFQSYHYVWLEVHPERDAEWLAARLVDGFHIHHLDGDHSNDAPKNLVLIDGVDHMRLHSGANWTGGIANWRDKQRSSNEDGERAYNMKLFMRRPWIAVAKEFYGGVKPDGRIWSEHSACLYNLARKYAERNNKPWPPQGSGELEVSAIDAAA